MLQQRSFRSPIACCLAALFAAPAFCNDPEPRARPRLSAEVQYRADRGEEYDSRDDEKGVHAQGDWVELPAYQVKGDEHDFIFDSEKREFRRVPFTWKDGGTFFRHRNDDGTTTELMFRFDPENNVVRLFNFTF